MIRILLVDDHAIIRRGIREVLEKTGEIDVVGEAGDGRQGVEMARRLKPDVVLMDIMMPGMDGIEATQLIVSELPQTKVLVLSAYADNPYPSLMFKNGAMGYLTKEKDCIAEELLRGIRTVLEGRRFMVAKVAERLAHMAIGENEETRFDGLSRREMQVLALVVKGNSIQEMASKLGLSDKTINTYRYRLYGKLGVQNDVQMTLMALKSGIFDLKDL